jgi:hypothetical protein
MVMACLFNNAGTKAILGDSNDFGAVWNSELISVV